MRFGFGLITCQRHPRDPRSDVELYADALALSEEAERLGFDSVWVSEHHFWDDGYMPALLPTCAAIAARTQRVRIGTGVLLAPLYQPVRLAENAATVDLLASGRLVLGLGLGWRAEEFEVLGIPQRGLGRRLEEIIETLRSAWSQDGLVAGASVTPKPARPEGPAIWLGGRAERAVRRAGRMADGFMATGASPERFRELVTWVREELERAGRDPAGFTFSALADVFPWRGGGGWERVRDAYHFGRWKYQDLAEARGRRPPSPLPPPLDAEGERALRAMLVEGEPAQVAERLRAYEEAAGAEIELVARVYWPGLDPAVQREAMAVLAEDVIPQLR